MSKWIEYRPETGVIETNYYDEDEDKLHVTMEQDVSGLLDVTSATRNSGSTNQGIKKGLWHYCSIPLSVQYEMLIKHGVNIHDRNHWPKVFDLVNKHYPYLKTTDKVHAYRNQGSVYSAVSYSEPKNSPSEANSIKHGKSLIVTSDT